MANPAKHNDPFDSLDDLDDEFVDYKARLDAEDDYAVDSYAAPYAAETPARDPFADAFEDEPEALPADLQRQAFAAPTGSLASSSKEPECSRPGAARRGSGFAASALSERA